MRNVGPGDDRRQRAAAAPADRLEREGPAAGPGLARRFGRTYVRPAIEGAAQRPRVWKYRLLSTCRRLRGEPVLLQPVLFVGPGEVVLGEGVQFGWKASPLYYAGYCHVEVSAAEARIEVGDRTEFNNNLMIKSEGARHPDRQDGLFGANVEIFDSNFHDLDPTRRKAGTQRMAAVEIGDDVFVGMGVKILKGVDDRVRLGDRRRLRGQPFDPGGVVAAGNPGPRDPRALRRRWSARSPLEMMGEEPPEDVLSNEDLTAAAAEGLRWIAYSRIAIELALFGSMVFLARLIPPAAFGIFAVIVIVQELALTMPMEGVGGALVQRKSVSRNHLQGGWRSASRSASPWSRSPSASPSP